MNIDKYTIYQWENAATREVTFNSFVLRKVDNINVVISAIGTIVTKQDRKHVRWNCRGECWKGLVRLPEYDIKLRNHD